MPVRHQRGGAFEQIALADVRTELRGLRADFRSEKFCSKRTDFTG